MVITHDHAESAKGRATFIPKNPVIIVGTVKTIE